MDFVVLNKTSEFSLIKLELTPKEKTKSRRTIKKIIRKKFMGELWGIF
jgi:hypothetical protein